MTILKDSKGIQKIINLLHSKNDIPLRLLVEILTPYAIALKGRKIEEFVELAQSGYEVICTNLTLDSYKKINKY